MKSVVYKQDEHVLPWVAKRIDAPFFAPDAVSIGFTEDGKLVSAVVFEHFTGNNVFMHVAVDDPSKVSRHDLKVAFAYPFLALGCQRVSGLVRVDNEKAKEFDERLGFREEGVMRSMAADGTDMIMYGMLKSECRWIGAKR